MESGQGQRSRAQESCPNKPEVLIKLLEFLDITTTSVDRDKLQGLFWRNYRTFQTDQTVEEMVNMLGGVEKPVVPAPSSRCLIGCVVAQAARDVELCEANRVDIQTLLRTVTTTKEVRFQKFG